MAQYRKKPVIIEAHLYDGQIRPAKAFMGIKDAEFDTDSRELVIPTLEGNMTASVGDYIIKGVKGEFYPCRADIFKLTYDLVEDAVQE